MYAFGNCSRKSSIAELISAVSGVWESNISRSLTLSFSARDLSSEYSEASAIPMTKSGSRNCSKGDKAECVGGGNEVDKSYSRIPVGNAKGENMSRR